MITTEQRLIEFLKEYQIESNEYNKEFLVFIGYGLLDEFADIIGESFFDEEGETVTMKFGYICIDILPICEYLDINTSKVLRVLKK